MENDSKRFGLGDIHTGYFVFFGAVAGAVLGLLTYVNDWL